MTDKEMKTKIDDLSTWEEELNGYAREIQERERAVQLAEQNIAKRPDLEANDYLFDRINADNRKMVWSVPPVIQIAPQQTDHVGLWTFVMATVAAISTIVALATNLIG